MSNLKSLIFIVIAVALGYLLVYPGFDDIKILIEEKSKYKNILNVAENIDIKKAELLKQYENINSSDKESIDKILPDNFNFISLVYQINSIGSRYGININSPTFKELSGSVGNNIGEAKPKNQYKSAIVGFSFESSYDQFNGFIRELEKSLRILDIKSLKIESRPKGIYDFSVEFETYWLN